jgi:hypothetical protein
VEIGSVSTNTSPKGRSTARREAHLLRCLARDLRQDSRRAGRHPCRIAPERPRFAQGSSLIIPDPAHGGAT